HLIPIWLLSSLCYSLERLQGRQVHCVGRTTTGSIIDMLIKTRTRTASKKVFGMLISYGCFSSRARLTTRSFLIFQKINCSSSKTNTMLRSFFCFQLLSHSALG